MKAQSALEFLMTYGWAILIVIAVVAALYAMGVFKLPSGGLGQCSPCFPPGAAVAYVDHNADSLVLRVGPSALANINATVGTTTSSNVASANPGDTVTLTGTGLFAGDASVTIAYTDASSGLGHTVTATVHGA